MARAANLMISGAELIAQRDDVLVEAAQPGLEAVERADRFVEPSLSLRDRDGQLFAAHFSARDVGPAAGDPGLEIGRSLIEARYFVLDRRRALDERGFVGAGRRDLTEFRLGRLAPALEL